MKDWTEWETIHHEVAVGGQVLDEGGDPFAGAEIAIALTGTATPKKSRAAAAGAKSDKSGRHSYCTVSRPDGLFYFLDLPDGRYTVTAIDPGSGKQDQKSLLLARAKAQPLQERWVDLKLG